MTFKRTHGMTDTPTYSSWVRLRVRCNNKNDKDYPNYGGRGIKVCERWEEFENFFSDMGERPEGKTLDRINNNGNYEPGNCRWADKEQQVNNTRRSRIIEHDGQSMTVAQWARKTGIKPATLYARLKSRSTAIETKTSTETKIPEAQLVESIDDRLSHSELARKYGISPQTLRARLLNGLTLERALTLPMWGRQKPRKPNIARRQPCLF